MTTSIVFDENRLCTDFSFNDNPNLNPYSSWLTDPNASRDALQALRIMKSRESGDEPITIDINGRETGNNIDLTEVSYDAYRMRRKIEVLKYKKNNFENLKTEYSYYSRSGKSKYKSTSNRKLKQLKEENKCDDTDMIIKPATNSGIFGDNTALYYDSRIKYNEKL